MRRPPDIGRIDEAAGVGAPTAPKRLPPHAEVEDGNDSTASAGFGRIRRCSSMSHYVAGLVAARAALLALRPAPLEIACPAAPGAPLHIASYDPETETLTCPECGTLSAAELCERVEAEWSAIDVHPPLAADEARVEAMAAKLLEALPGEASLAVELAVAWGHWSLAGRLPEDHLAASAERALDRIAA